MESGTIAMYLCFSSLFSCKEVQVFFLVFKIHQVGRIGHPRGPVLARGPYRLIPRFKQQYCIMLNTVAISSA